MKLDAKFEGEIRKVKDGSLVPEDQYVVFLAKDNCFAEMLPIYLAKMHQGGMRRRARRFSITDDPPCARMACG